MKHLITLVTLLLLGCSSTNTNLGTTTDAGQDATGGAAGAAGAAGSGGSAGSPGGSGGAAGAAGAAGSGNYAVPCTGPQWEVTCPTGAPKLCAHFEATNIVHCVECNTNTDCTSPKTCNQEWYVCQ